MTGAGRFLSLRSSTAGKENLDMVQRIETVLDEYVRPVLGQHGGNVVLSEVEDGIVRIRLTGKCAGCPAADLTAEELIRTELLERIPELKNVVLVQEVSPALLEQARAILKLRANGS